MKLYILLVISIILIGTLFLSSITIFGDVLAAIGLCSPLIFMAGDYLTRSFKIYMYE